MKNPCVSVVSVTLNYYPFGMGMPNRSWSVGSSEEYRFGFNGKENDDAIKGDDNSLDFGARIYDCRVGRWLTPDPETYLYAPVSPFAFAINNPIKFVDLDGNIIYDSEGNALTITFNEETGEIADISGTTNVELKQAIIDTWNESPTGKTTITELNAQDVKVQVVLRDKVGYYQNDDGKLEPVNGLTCSFTVDNGATHYFTDENGNTYDYRIYLFNTTASPELTPSNVDIIGNKDLMPLTDEEKIAAVETHNKIIKKEAKKKSKNPSESEPNPFKGLDNQEILILMANDDLMKTDRAFGRVSVLIHENVHLQDKQQNREGDGELSPWRAQIKSYRESGKPYLQSKD